MLIPCRAVQIGPESNGTVSSFSEDWHKLCSRLCQMSYCIIFIYVVLEITYILQVQGGISKTK